MEDEIVEDDDWIKVEEIVEKGATEEEEEEDDDDETIEPRRGRVISWKEVIQPPASWIRC